MPRNGPPAQSPLAPCARAIASLAIPSEISWRAVSRSIRPWSRSCEAIENQRGLIGAQRTELEGHDASLGIDEDGEREHGLHAERPHRLEPGLLTDQQGVLDRRAARVFEHRGA